MCECAKCNLSERASEEKYINIYKNIFEVDNQNHITFLYQVNVAGRLWQTFASRDIQMALRINTPHSRSQEGTGSSDEAAVCVYDY